MESEMGSIFVEVGEIFRQMFMMYHEFHEVTVEFVQIFLWGLCQPQNSWPTFTKMLVISLSINRFPKIRILR